MSKGRSKGRKSKRSVANKGQAMAPIEGTGVARSGMRQFLRAAGRTLGMGGDAHKGKNLSAVRHGQRYKDNYGREYVKLPNGSVMRAESYAVMVDRQAAYARASAARKAARAVKA